MDYVLIAFVSQVAVSFSFILGYEFYRRTKMTLLGPIKVPTLAPKETYWRKAG
jgi:hypothetical protein